MRNDVDESRWPLVQPYLAGGGMSRDPEVMKNLEAKFRRGEKEHGVGGWETWPPERFDAEIADELRDAVLYVAMKAAAAAAVRAAMPLNANDMARKVRAANGNTEETA